MQIVTNSANSEARKLGVIELTGNPRDALMLCESRPPQVVGRIDMEGACRDHLARSQHKMKDKDNMTELDMDVGQMKNV